MFLSKKRAIESAKSEMNSISGVRALAPLSKAKPGEPVIVKDLHKQPSYWLVPFIIEGKVAGFARVLGNGKIAQIGAFNPENVPTLVSRIDASEARRVAAERISPEKGESLAVPVFVHDGPIGREAWLIEVLKDSKPTRWIFIISPSTVYERQAGEPRLKLLDEKNNKG
jgi:hypothetical protein